MLTASRLRKLLSYNAASGVFRWKDVGSGPIRPGDVAGGLHRSKQRQIRVNGQLYQAGRLAWLYETGNWPRHQISYVNVDHNDLRWKNLRETTPAQRRASSPSNSKFGVKGVWKTRYGKYAAQIKVAQQLKYLGSFDTLSEANAAYAKAAQKAFGSFARAS